MGAFAPGEGFVRSSRDFESRVKRIKIDLFSLPPRIGDEWQLSQRNRAIVSGDAADALRSAAKAAMNEQFLAAARAKPDRLHQRAALATPVARMTEIDMA